MPRLTRQAITGRILGLTLAVATAMPASVALGQAGDDALRSGVNIVVPQRRAWIQGEVRSQIEIRKVEVVASTAEQAATTTLRLTVFNHGNQMAEAQVLLPVPDGAAVGKFVLEGLGEDGIAKIMPADEARKIYNQIVASMKDPALLEFVGTSLVRSSVFPVPAGGEQTVSLTYDHTLESVGDRVEYVLPRSAELMLQGAPWSFALTIDGSRPIATVYSPTHDIGTEKLNATSVKVSVGPEAFSGTPGSMRVGWLREPLEAGMLASSFLAYPDADGGGYFMLVAGPPALEGEREVVKREVTLVIDKSGSMRGEKIVQAREAAIQVISGLNEGEYFNVIAYSDTINKLSERAVVKTTESEAEAIAFINDISAVGGTNIHDALVSAMRTEPAEGVLPMVIFLTDGLPTVGITQETAIREAVAKGNTHERRVFGFGVGYDVNAPLLTAVSRETRGAPTFVLPQEDVEVKVGQVFRRLTGPVLASPTLKPGTASRVKDMLPGELPDIFEGDQLIVLGRYTDQDKALKFTLSGQGGEGERTFGMSFDPKRASVEHSFVPRLWAQRRIAQLVDAVRQAGADGKGEAVSKELIDEIVALSTRWGILTEYTSFLAIESGVDLDDQMAFGQRDADVAGAVRLGAQVSETASAPARTPEANLQLALRRAGRERTGLGGVQQEASNFYAGQRMSVMTNSVQTAGGAQVILTGMRQVADQTLFSRNGQWVDSSLLEAVEANNADVDETVEFASERYFELADELAAEKRQGVLALGQDVLLNRGGRVILVKRPVAETP
ncbi:MAG: VIT and VWA domain-containing protein [Phycisphaera sp.]|nr:MAG: VIT and VWA domain-containing protein [Phycisphaera sp.]